MPTLLFASMLFAQGCDSPSSPSDVPLGQPFELAAGASAQVDGLTVSFDRVSQDSRCPIDAVCVWQGDAAVVLTLRAAPAGAASRELHTGVAPQEMSFASYLVRLVALSPAPRAGVAIAPADYRATLLVSR